MPNLYRSKMPQHFTEVLQSRIGFHGIFNKSAINQNAIGVHKVFVKALLTKIISFSQVFHEKSCMIHMVCAKLYRLKMLYSSLHGFCLNPRSLLFLNMFLQNLTGFHGAEWKSFMCKILWVFTRFLRNSLEFNY